MPEVEKTNKTVKFDTSEMTPYSADKFKFYPPKKGLYRGDIFTDDGKVFAVNWRTK